MKKHLNTLFVTTQGAYLSKEGETVVVKVDREVRLRVSGSPAQAFAQVLHLAINKSFTSPYSANTNHIHLYAGSTTDNDMEAKNKAIGMKRGHAAQPSSESHETDRYLTGYCVRSACPKRSPPSGHDHAWTLAKHSQRALLPVAHDGALAGNGNGSAVEVDRWKRIRSSSATLLPSVAFGDN